MKLILDTHSLMWYLLDAPRLSGRARTLMMDIANELLVSPASYWETAVKVSLGKYVLDADFAAFFEEQLAANHLAVLPITVRHAAVAALPFYHRDPFDRLIIAQAMVEQVPVLSADSAFDSYPVARVW